jgi:hypothetical protein
MHSYAYTCKCCLIQSQGVPQGFFPLPAHAKHRLAELLPVYINVINIALPQVVSSGIGFLAGAELCVTSWTPEFKGWHLPIMTAVRPFVHCIEIFCVQSNTCCCLVDTCQGW